MFCPNCGSSVPENSKFCPSCGSNLMQDSYQDPYASPQKPYGNPQESYGGPVPPTSDGVYESPQQSQDLYQSPAPQSSGPVRTDRDIIMYILLSIITCGIYGYWYIYEMAKDANIMCQNDGDETPELLIYLLLSLVTCGIYSYYWMYKLGNRLQQNGPRYGLDLKEGGSDVLIWVVLGYFTCNICSFIGINIILRNMNTMAHAYNRTYGYE